MMAITMQRCKKFSFLLGHSVAAVLDALLGVGSSENDDGIKLGVVKFVHGIRSHVQESVFPAIHDLANGG